MILPYWNTDLDLEIAPWFPLGLDYHPVSHHRFDSPQVNRIASHCLAFDSEFLFMSSLRSGYVGSLIRDNFFKDEPSGPPLLGFVLILAYSPEIERIIIDILTDPVPDFKDQCGVQGVECGKEQGDPESEAFHTELGSIRMSHSELIAGVARCSLWTRMNGHLEYEGYEGTVEGAGGIEIEAKVESAVDSWSNSQGLPEDQFRSNHSILMGTMKVIAVVSENIFFDETDFLTAFEARLESALNESTSTRKNSRAAWPFFAEKFGYRRFSLPYDTDDPMQLSISQILHEIEFAETRQVVGPAPEVPFPPLIMMRQA